MDKYHEQLIAILDKGIENNAISHEFYKSFCQTYYLNGLNEISLVLYNLIVEHDIVARKHEDTKNFYNKEEEFIFKALKTNDPVYLEYAKAYSKLLKVRSQNEPRSNATLEYAATREKIARRYSSLTVPKTTLRIPAKSTTEIKRMGKWKSSAVDDLARTLVELSCYSSSFSSLVG